MTTGTENKVRWLEELDNLTEILKSGREGTQAILGHRAVGEKERAEGVAPLSAFADLLFDKLRSARINAQCLIEDISTLREMF